MRLNIYPASGYLQVLTRETMRLCQSGASIFKPGENGFIGYFHKSRCKHKLAYFASPHPQLSVGLWSHGGYMTQSAPIYELFALGGAGHFSNAALRFVGLKRDALRAFRFVSAGISIWSHMKFWESMPRSAVGIFYQGGLYNNPDRSNTRIHGFGIGGYINTTILGPIRVDIVSTEKKDIQVYTAIGFAF